MDNSRSKSWWLLLGAVSTGLLAFFVTTPAYILDPTNLEWIFHQPSIAFHAMDFHPHYLGWYYLRHAPVSFPLGSIPNFVSPLGTYMAYTDSIPLLAFLFRTISQWLPEDFQYLGPWVLICFVLQAVFALRVLRRWIQDPFCLVIAVAFVAFSPILIFRWNHIGLMSHWLLLWCIDLNCEYFAAKRSEDKAKIPVWRPIWALSLATLIQPYIAAMVGGLCWGLPLSRFLGDRVTQPDRIVLHICRVLGMTVCLLVPMFLLLYVFGFSSGASTAEGFHWFSTDLLAMFNNTSTSSFVPSFRSKAGLYEGYAWLGLGGWVFLMAMLRPRVRTRIRSLAKNPHFKGVMIVCGLMWFYAFGERIYIGTFWIVDLEWFWMPLRAITSTLRVAGRMIWPGYYVLLMVSMVATANFYDKKKARLIFAAAMLFQMVDLGPWILGRSLRYPIYGRQKLTSPFWENEASHFAHIKLIPPYQEGGLCKSQGASYQYEWPELAKFSALHNLTINSGYLARYDRFKSNLYCGAHTYEFLVGPLARDTLYVVRRGFETEVPMEASDRSCRDIDGYMVCVAKDS